MIAIDTEEKLKEYRFIEGLEKRWDEEFSEKTRYNTKGLRNNASRFKKKRKRSRGLQNLPQIIEEPNTKKKIKWDNEKKFKLVQLEEQARNGGIEFMERLKKL